MPGFCICKSYTSSECYEHPWSKFHSVLNMSLVLNMPGLGIWPGRDYARVIQGCEYV